MRRQFYEKRYDMSPRTRAKPRVVTVTMSDEEHATLTALAEGTERSAAGWTRDAIVVTYRGMEEEAARLNALSQGRPYPPSAQTFGNS